MTAGVAGRILVHACQDGASRRHLQTRYFVHEVDVRSFGIKCYEPDVKAVSAAMKLSRNEARSAKRKAYKYKGCMLEAQASASGTLRTHGYR